MPIHNLDDATADALLSGRSPLRRGDGDDAATLAGLGDLVARIRNAGATRPRPNVLLTEVLNHGVAAIGPPPEAVVADPFAAVTPHGSASATESTAPNLPDSTHHEVAPRTPAGRRRKPRARELVAAKLAAVGFAAKFGAGSVAVLAATAGAGTVGALPGPLQERFVAIPTIEAAVTEQDAELPPTGSNPQGSSEGGANAASDTDPDGRASSNERPGVEGQEIAEAARSGEPGVDGREIASEASNLRSGWGRQLAERAQRAADQRRPDQASERAGDARGSGKQDHPGTGDDSATAGKPGNSDNPGAADDRGASDDGGSAGRAEGDGQQGGTSEDPPAGRGSEERAGEDSDEDPEEGSNSEQPPEQAPGSDTRP